MAETQNTCGYCQYLPKGGAGKCKHPIIPKLVTADDTKCDDGFKLKDIYKEQVQEKTKDKKDAQKIYLSGDPLKFLLDTLEKKYLGNRDALETLVLSAVSSQSSFSIRLNVALIGDSDSGKTAAAEAVLSVISSKNKYPYHRVTPKALYYEAMGNIKKEKLPVSFKDKVLFLDDVTKDTVEILKNIANTGNEPPSFVTVIDGESKAVKFDAQPVVWTTAVDLSEDYQGQCDRRYYTVEIKPVKDVGKFIIENECKNLEPLESKDFFLANTIMENIMNCNTIVDIEVHDYAFAKTNTDKKFFIAMVRAIAKIRNPTEGRITATKEDIAEASRLFKANDSQVTKLKSGALELIDYIPDTEPTKEDLEDSNTSPHTAEAIYASYSTEHPGVSLRTIRRYLLSLVNKSEINEVTGKFQRKYYYAV